MRGLCLGVLALAWAGAASAQNADDAAAIARGQRAVSWIQGYECPKPGQPLQVANLGTEAEIQRALNENWAFMQNSVSARQQALQSRDTIAAELNASGSRATPRLQRSFDELDAALNALDYRVANAHAQWALANYVIMSRAPADYDMMSGRPNPLADFVPVVRAIESLTGNFGEPVRNVFQRFQGCWIAANDVYLDAAAPIARARINQADTMSEIDRLLAQIAVVPHNPELPGGQVVAEAQGKRMAIEAEIERLAALERARSDAAERARLERQANATLSVASRYMRALNRGDVGAAGQLLDPNVRLLSQRNGNATGRSAVVDRMRQAAGSGEQVNMGEPQITSGFRVQSILSARGQSGTMTFQAANGLITLIEIRQ